MLLPCPFSSCASSQGASHMDGLPLHRCISSCTPKRILTPSTSHTGMQSLFIMASPHEDQRGFPLSAHSSHVAVDRGPHTWRHSLFIFVSSCKQDKALHSLYLLALLMCLDTGKHTSGCTPSSSRRLLMSAEKDFLSLPLSSCGC